MKLSSQVHLHIVVLSALLLAIAAAPRMAAQQPANASPPAAKPVIEEWVYRVKYDHQDEWFRIFKKYQLAILERQKRLGM